ncbi:hypothetical protein F5887DRAFT_1004070 [Amanita rubescens]|nr:hypothetical protein F5887DRAFT_1004070 [Amanita rubescens]
MRDSITKLREELSSLKSNRGPTEQSLRTAQNNVTSLTNEVTRLRLQLRDSREKRSELETTVKQDETEAQSLRQRIETLQRQYEETKNALQSTIAERHKLQNLLDGSRNDISQKTETVRSLSSSVQQLQSVMEELEQRKATLTRQSGEIQMTLESQKNELKGTLDSTTVERDQLRNLLDDARRDIEQKTETIRSLTSELQHPQRDIEETEARKGMSTNQLMEMHQTVKRQMEEIKRLKQNLVDVKKSRETVTEELRLERERIRDKDNKFTKMKEVTQARGAEALAFQRSKQDGVLKVGEAVAKKLTESQGVDALSKAGELQYQVQERRRSATTGLDWKRPLYEGTAGVDSSQVITGATQNTHSPAVISRTLIEEPDEMDIPSSTSTKRRPTPVRSNTGALTSLLEGIPGVRGFWTSTSQTRKTLPG